MAYHFLGEAGRGFEVRLVDYRIDTVLDVEWRHELLVSIERILCLSWVLMIYVVNVSCLLVLCPIWTDCVT